MDMSDPSLMIGMAIIVRMGKRVSQADKPDQNES
jgi:hypothetical protein